MKNISGLVLTKNNESTISNCINSIIDLCDEIIVIDDGSIDNTISILKTFDKVKLFYRNLNGDFASQRNFGISKATYDWILVIDSDEYLDYKLHKAIANLNLEDKYVYTCNRLNINFSRSAIVHLKERPILMHKSYKFIDKQHERIIYKKSVRINGNIIHDCWTNLSDFVEDINIYSTRKAIQWIEEGRKYPKFYLFFRQILVSIINTLYRLFIQLRILGGYKAIFYCLYWSSEDLLVGMKYIELLEKSTEK